MISQLSPPRARAPWTLTGWKIGWVQVTSECFQFLGMVGTNGYEYLGLYVYL